MRPYWAGKYITLYCTIQPWSVSDQSPVARSCRTPPPIPSLSSDFNFDARLLCLVLGYENKYWASLHYETQSWHNVTITGYNEKYTKINFRYSSRYFVSFSGTLFRFRYSAPTDSDSALHLSFWSTPRSSHDNTSPPGTLGPTDTNWSTTEVDTATLLVHYKRWTQPH